MPLILGINAYHADSSACLIAEGQLIAAVEEERFRRSKHWAGLPSQAIHYCLNQASLRLSEIDLIAVNSDPKANLLRKISFLVAKRPEPRLVIDRIKKAKERVSIKQRLEQSFPREKIGAEVHHVEHHLAHLGSSFFVSPFAEAVTVSVDGFGDFASAAWGVGTEGGITIDDKVFFPHSLGIFYQALTQFLGFPKFGDEFKVMGLAPYGAPTFLSEMREIVRLRPDGTFRLNMAFFRHHKERIVDQWDECEPAFGTLYSDELARLIGAPREPGVPIDQRHEAIAHSVQAMYEEAFFHLLNALHSKYDLDSVTLAGGCAMNSVANGKIRLRTPFKRVYVQAAPGDAGGAIGAAFVALHRVKRDAGTVVMDHPYLGPAFSGDDIAALLADHAEQLRLHGCTVEKITDEAALCDQTARAIIAGQVVGWFHGRMEWGPRALGNRSILCDPRRAEMREIMNLKIKKREPFRPFAPSILRDSVSEWFEQDGDVPFMMSVFQVKKERRRQIPAITHVDGSGRLQTVTRAANPRFHRLIERFNCLTGVPMLLNTSFNENEPVVCHPKEAIDCFLRTEMDLLVMENYFVRRQYRTSPGSNWTTC